MPPFVTSDAPIPILKKENTGVNQPSRSLDTSLSCKNDFITHDREIRQPQWWHTATGEKLNQLPTRFSSAKFCPSSWGCLCTAVAGGCREGSWSKEGQEDWRREGPAHVRKARPISSSCGKGYLSFTGKRKRKRESYLNLDTQPTGWTGKSATGLIDRQVGETEWPLALKVWCLWTTYPCWWKWWSW